MRYQTSVLRMLAIGAAMGVGAAMAADLPKEGTSSVKFPATGTFKAFPIGKERALLQFQGDGLTSGTGLFDHMAWHCFGMEDVSEGMAQWYSYCVASDPAGDLIASNWTAEKHAVDAKSYPAAATLLAGSGKYAGISGSVTATVEGPMAYRAADPAIYVCNANLQASYKLP